MKWHPMAPFPTPPCVALRGYYSTDQCLPDVTAGLIINYYTSVDQNEHIWLCPASPALARGDWMTAYCTFKPPVHHASLEDTSQSPRRSSRTCLETTSATPPVTCRVKPTTESRARSERPWFYHNKALSATACLELAPGDIPLYFLQTLCSFQQTRSHSLVPSKTNTKGCIQRVQIYSVYACDATRHCRDFEKAINS